MALKLLLSSAGSSDVARRRFDRELRALCRFEHPHVVRILEAGEHRGLPFLALEFIEGESLQQRLDRAGPLPLREALDLVISLSHALQAVHGQGLLHRDLKPANVLVRATTGEPILVDFGLVRDFSCGASFQELTRTGQFHGTPGYWSPEQARGDTHRLGPATDVYGLGALLHALLTAAPPIQPDSLVDALALLERPPPPLRAARPDVPAWVEAVVGRALARDPADRFASAQELADALEAEAPARRSAPRGPLLVALALILGGASLAFALVRRAPAEQADRADPVKAALAVAADHFDAQRWREAAEAYAQVLRLDPDLAEGHSNRGSALGNLGDLEGAVACFDEFLRLKPGSAPGLYFRGEACSRLGRHAEAERDFTAALRLEPDHAWADDARAYVGKRSLARGIERQTAGDYPAAVAELTRAAECLPDSFGAHANRGIALAKAGEPQLAIEAFDRALQLDPDSAGILWKRGSLRADLGDATRALEDLDAAIQLDPQAADALLKRGWLRIRLDDIQGALADHTRALELRPESAGIWEMRGRLRGTQNDLQGAIEDFERALELDPQHADARENLERTRQALARRAGTD